ncbi:MAG: hypothetical protein ACO3RX_07735, partial [Chthoniobacterales bacterium]
RIGIETERLGIHSADSCGSRVTHESTRGSAYSETPRVEAASGIGAIRPTWFARPCPAVIGGLVTRERELRADLGFRAKKQACNQQQNLQIARGGSLHGRRRREFVETIQTTQAKPLIQKE